MSDTYVVAELGQNMQGCVELARDMIYRAANPVHPEPGMAEKPWAADAVKTTKRALDAECSRSQQQRRYTDPEKSFALSRGTYQEHRERLELSWDEHRDLCQYAHDQGLDFGITLCSPRCVGRMNLHPDFLKVASRDLSHLPLLREMARTRIPMILSTGMADRRDLDRALEAIEQENGIVHAILHCTSTYPCDWSDANLRTITYLRERLGDEYKIGYSDHTQGVQAGAWAVMLGAEWIEAHITPSRALRGGDHAVSLDLAGGLWRYVRNIRHAEEALGQYGIVVPDSVEKARRKLERSLCAAEDLTPGTEIGSSNTVLLSGGKRAWERYGENLVRWTERDRLFGRELREGREAGTVLSSTMVG